MIDDFVIGDYELIVVDDKSTDRTPELADALALADPHVRVVHHPVNRKLGGSIKTGFETAKGDLVLYSDADLPFDFEEVPRAIRLLRLYDADLVSAYRFDRTGEGYTRAIYTFFYNLLIRTMFGVKARDINFAFKLLRRRVLDKIELRSEGSFIDAELIIRALRSGFELQQFGVDYFPRTRGQSTLSSFGVNRHNHRRDGPPARGAAGDRTTQMRPGQRRFRPSLAGTATVPSLGWRAGKAAICEPLDLLLPRPISH